MSKLSREEKGNHTNSVDKNVKPFWKEKSFQQMTRKEWESLCDGCGKCCVFKLEDEDTGIVRYTNVACHLLDLNTCRCGNYKVRGVVVPTCMILTPRRVNKLNWLPKSCAYRLLKEGKDLPQWHHLVSGNSALVHKEGHSILGKVVSEKSVPLLQLYRYIVDWE